MTSALEGGSLRWERAAYLGMVVVVMAYLVLRACLVPFVQDEARTFFLYNAVGRFQPWYSYWDAANHLLNTALGQVGYLAWGPHAWSLRAFNVASFLLYAWYLWRIGGSVRKRAVRWCLWSAMLCTPFLLEFFSLYRGYALGIAFFLMALFHLLRFSATAQRIHLVGALVGSLFAATASLTLLLLWCGVLGLLGLRLLDPERALKDRMVSWSLWCLLGLLPLIYLGTYAVALAEHGTFYYGSDRGLITGTLTSLCQSVFVSDAPWLVMGIALLVSMIIMVEAVGCMRDCGRRIQPLAIVVFVLLVEVSGRYLLAGLMAISYPIDRTAMHLIVVVLLVVGFGLDGAAQRIPALQWSALVFLALPYHALKEAGLQHTFTWPQQAISEGLFDRVQQASRSRGRAPVLGATPFLCAPWALRNLTRPHALSPAQQVSLGVDGPDLLLIASDDTARFPGYRVTAYADDDAVVLCERKTLWRTELLLDTLLNPLSDPKEFFMLWRPRSGTVQGKALLIELEARISSPEALEAWVVFADEDTSGTALFYSAQDLLEVRTRWCSDTLRAQRWMPLSGSPAGRPYVCFWNKRHQAYSFLGGRLRIHRVLAD